MAGHSKWANIKVRKGKVDAQRANIHETEQEIAIAVKQGRT